MTYVGLDYRFDLNSISKDVLTKKFIFIGFAAWLLMVPLAITSSKKMIAFT
jgi:sulfoxide reductase heme-binding subunit YedZ